MTCGAVFERLDAKPLVCELPPDHLGPVHRDGDHEWGDQNLAQPVA